MAKLTQYETPTGSKGDLLNPSDWMSKILGVIVMMVVVATGQNIASKVGGKTGIDTKIDPIISTPVKAENKKVIL